MLLDAFVIIMCRQIEVLWKTWTPYLYKGYHCDNVHWCCSWIYWIYIYILYTQSKLLIFFKIWGFSYIIYHRLALNSILLQSLWCSHRSPSYLNALYMDGIIKEPTSLLKRELESWLNAEECLLHAFEEDWNLMLIIMVLKLCGSRLLGTPLQRMQQHLPVSTSIYIHVQRTLFLLPLLQVPWALRGDLTET